MNTDQKEENQFPQWVKDAKMWQCKDTEKRAFILIALDETSFFGKSVGNSAALLIATLEAIKEEKELLKIFEDALKLHENPKFADLFKAIYVKSNNLE